MNQRFDVVTFGAFNIDQTREVADFKPDGEVMSLATSHTNGGSHVNTAEGEARLGHKVAVMGAVGYDADDHGVLSDLESAGVSTELVATKPDQPTGEVLAIVSPAGRSMIASPGANSHYNIADVQEAIRKGATNTRLVHLTSFVGQEQADTQLTAQEFLISQLAPETLVSFAPGDLYTALGLGRLALILSRTDYLIGNAREIGQLAETEEADYQTAAETLLAKFPHIRAVAVTLGSGRYREDFYRSQTLGMTLAERLGFKDVILSSVIFTQAGERIDIEKTPFNEPIADSTGAGDAWTAGFLHGVLDDRELRVCGVMGDLVAQHSLTARGARAGLPTLAQLNTRLHETMASKDS